ncbi:MAG: hypothetical protein AAB278_00350 [Pseudomonadota bacterium]
MIISPVTSNVERFFSEQSLLSTEVASHRPHPQQRVMSVVYKLVLLVVALTIFSANTKAEGMAVSAHISALGQGVELTHKYSDEFNAKIGFHQYRYQGTEPLSLFSQMNTFWTDILGLTKSDNIYDHDGKQQVVLFIGDWYPNVESQFRYSLGLAYNEHEDRFSGRELIVGGYNLGANHYSGSQVGNLQGVARYNKFAPYFGLGWGNPVAKNKKWGAVFDAGLLRQGRPDVTLTTSGTVAPADLAAEQTRLVNDSWTWSPRVSVGVSYQW